MGCLEALFGGLRGLLAQNDHLLSVQCRVAVLSLRRLFEVDGATSGVCFDT